MSQYPRKRVHQIIDAEGANNMTGTDVLDAVTNIESARMGAYQVVWIGTPNGSFTVWGSVNGVDFEDLGLPSLPAVGGSAGTAIISITDLAFQWLRLRYVNASSVGQLNAWFVGKGE